MRKLFVGLAVAVAGVAAQAAPASAVTVEVASPVPIYGGLPFNNLVGETLRPLWIEATNKTNPITGNLPGVQVPDGNGGYDTVQYSFTCSYLGTTSSGEYMFGCIDSIGNTFIMYIPI